MRLTNRDKQLLKHSGFKLVTTTSEFEPDYKQYIKHIKHPVLQGLFIAVDGDIYVWCKEDKEGLTGQNFLIAKRKYSPKNLLELIVSLT